jgi:hypothetical protein
MSLYLRGVSEKTDDKVPNAPQSADDAPEAAEQHGRCNVNRLIWCVLISLCCLARTQIRKCNLGQAEPHDVLDGELSIVQQDCAVEWIRILYAMAGQMKNVSRCVLEQ